jgi:hypothetical protein
MSEESDLRDKLRKTEALLARPGTPGEQQAAAAACARLRARLAELEDEGRSREFRISIANPYSAGLFRWLCRRYQVRTYRYPRQRRTTIVFRTSDRINRMLWREFGIVNAELRAHLKEVAQKFILDKVPDDKS